MCSKTKDWTSIQTRGPTTVVGVVTRHFFVFLVKTPNPCMDSDDSNKMMCYYSVLSSFSIVSIGV